MKNKIKGLSLFSNVGVAEAYLKELGIDICIANELDETRAEFYKHLYPNTNMIVGDITDEHIVKQVIQLAQENDIEFIIATPPCQGMSLAGKLDPMDERNQLIYYAIEIIKQIKPKYVFLENVPQQLKTKIRHNGELVLIPDYIKMELEHLYEFNNEPIVKAMDYEVPQMRKRSIILMVRKDLGYTWEFPPKIEPVITLEEALKGIPSLEPMLREGYEETIQLLPQFEEKREKALQLSKWHKPPVHAKRHVEWLMHTPSGCTAFDNEIYYPQKCDGSRINGHYNTYRRLSWEKPARTITQNNGVVSSLACVHPGYLVQDDGTEQGRIYSDARCFSIYELLIVTSLPLDWNIPEWANERLIRAVIGEGIPPLLVKHIVGQLIKQLNKN